MSKIVEVCKVTGGCAGMFVIQERIRPSDSKYTTRPGRRYRTLDEARQAFDGLHPVVKAYCRIAEEYTVTRYKPMRSAPRGATG